MQIFQATFLCLVALTGSLITTATAESGCIREKICLEVVSQRFMTETDIKRINSLSLRRSVVRLRLINGSSNEVVYLTGLDSVEPRGFKLSKAKNDDELNFLPEAKERTEASLKSHFGGSLRYLRLSPNSALDFDVPDWGNPRHDGEDEEHAFSIFIKLGGVDGSDAPIELISEIFKPLKK